MDDQEWTKLKRLHRIDMVVTRVAYILAVVLFLFAVLDAVFGNVIAAFIWLALAAACFAVGRWKPRLIKIIDEEMP